MLNWIISIEQIIYIKMDLALNNLQRLICHKTQQTKPFIFGYNIVITWMYVIFVILNSMFLTSMGRNMQSWIL